MMMTRERTNWRKGVIWRSIRPRRDDSLCPREPVSRVLCPTELGGDHLSRAAVACRLVRPTRELRGEQPPACAERTRARILGLAPGGGCLAGRVTTPPVVSYTTFSPSPLRFRSGSLFLWPFSASHPAWVLPSTALCGARTFLTRRKRRARPPGSLGQCHLSTRVVLCQGAVFG